MHTIYSQEKSIPQKSILNVQVHTLKSIYKVPPCKAVYIGGLINLKIEVYINEQDHKL